MCYLASSAILSSFNTPLVFGACGYYQPHPQIPATYGSRRRKGKFLLEYATRHVQKWLLTNTCQLKLLFQWVLFSPKRQKCLLVSALARDKEFTKEERRLKRLESKLKNIKYQILESPVIVKKSSPKNLSADCRPFVGRQLADRRPTGFARNIGYLSADNLLTLQANFFKCC